jgi:hypothetical protein
LAYSNSNFYIENKILKLIIIIYVFLAFLSSRLIASISCYTDPYTGGFSCNCNIARLLVTGGAIGVVANSLLESGEFEGL